MRDRWTAHVDSGVISFVTIRVLCVPCGVFSFSRLTPSLPESRISAVVSRSLGTSWGDENKQKEQVSEIIGTD